MMPEIACTRIGRNALVAGLICHVAAILLGMVSAAGTEIFFKIVYLFSCIFMMGGAYAELRHRCGRHFRSWRFYLVAAVTVFPLLGPLVVLGLIYSYPGDGQEAQGNWSGLFPAILKLRASGWIVFVLLILLFLLFAVIHSKNDPYYKRRVPKSQSVQAVLNMVWAGDGGTDNYSEQR